MTKQDNVREASDKFYDALQQIVHGDATPMAEIWSHRDDVTAMHPIGGREVGWDAVRESWESIAELSAGGEVERTDQFIHVEGETAIELVTEHVSWSPAGQEVNGRFRGTNVYQLEDGGWKIIHHHVDTEANFIEILQDLEIDEQ